MYMQLNETKGGGLKFRPLGKLSIVWKESIEDTLK